MTGMCLISLRAREKGNTKTNRETEKGDTELKRQTDRAGQTQRGIKLW